MVGEKQITSYIFLTTPQTGNIEMWRRPVMPVMNGTYSYALAILNRGDSTPIKVRCKAIEITKGKGECIEI